MFTLSILQNTLDPRHVSPVTAMICNIRNLHKQRNKQYRPKTWTKFYE